MTSRFDEPVAAYLFKQVMVRRCLKPSVIKSIDHELVHALYPTMSIGSTIWRCAFQVTVNKLHKDGIYHRDIKLENFLVAREQGHYQLKVGAPSRQSNVRHIFVWVYGLMLWLMNA